ncbi:hypothetical protein TNCV_539601 [Trichonephila clavipes]|nr:hypothetical protein TNCV_539601 [Trichonephila clavipes]
MKQFSDVEMVKKYFLNASNLVLAKRWYLYKPVTASGLQLPFQSSGELRAYRTEGAEFYPPQCGDLETELKKCNLRLAVVAPSTRLKSNHKPSDAPDAT